LFLEAYHENVFELTNMQNRKRIDEGKKTSGILKCPLASEGKKSNTLPIIPAELNLIKKDVYTRP
jgi:hypothetical protein